MYQRYITKRFELSDIVRIPVQLSDDAKDFINLSCDEGRRLLNALSEIFGELGNVTKIEVSIDAASKYFPSLPEGEKLLIIVAYHSSTSPYRWLVPANQLLDRGFRAHLLVQELVNLYPHKDKK